MVEISLTEPPQIATGYRKAAMLCGISCARIGALSMFHRPTFDHLSSAA
jgi:hypothetical protein